MAEAKLNFDENALDKTSGVYDLYSRLYEGMRTASLVDAPSFDNPPLTPEGEIDSAAISSTLAGYSEILMKNSAYLFANSIITVVGDGGGSGPGVGFVSRNGDSMQGMFSALYGFRAGYNNQVILESSIDSQNAKWINVTGNLSVSEKAVVNGALELSDGVYFAGNKSIYYNQAMLHLASQDIALDGRVSVNGEFHVGDVLIDETGIYFNDLMFYHSGNSNKADVDWTMKNGNVNGTLSVIGTSNFTGHAVFKSGMDVWLNDKKLLYTESRKVTSPDGTQVEDPYTVIASDLKIIGGNGIKVDDSYVVRVGDGADKSVSFTAPGRIMKLGGNDGGVETVHIALQSAIKSYNGAYTIVSKFGDGYFPNSFSAGCGNAGSTVIKTFAEDASCGVLIPKELRFGDLYGPSIYAEKNKLFGDMAYYYMDDITEKRAQIGFSMYYADSTSPFKDNSKLWSATLNLDTEADFFAFNKPVEAVSFSIKSERYKTRLVENVLFFDDGTFLEGVVDGIRHSGNSYFDGNLSSQRFASGFAGYGWAIRRDPMVGGYGATFDELTVRKKMRVYELEVQKNSVTNGALWVSDSCSGDEVRAL